MMNTSNLIVTVLPVYRGLPVALYQLVWCVVEGMASRYFQGESADGLFLILPRLMNHQVFFVGMCLMFLLTTLDASTSHSPRPLVICPAQLIPTRFLSVVTAHLNVYAYTWGLSNQRGPLGTLNTWSRWDRFTHSVMVSLVLWIADFLAVRWTKPSSLGLGCILIGLRRYTDATSFGRRAGKSSSYPLPSFFLA